MSEMIGDMMKNETILSETFFEGVVTLIPDKLKDKDGIK